MSVEPRRGRSFVDRCLRHVVCVYRSSLTYINSFRLPSCQDFANHRVPSEISERDSSMTRKTVLAMATAGALALVAYSMSGVPALATGVQLNSGLSGLAAGNTDDANLVLVGRKGGGGGGKGRGVGRGGGGGGKATLGRGGGGKGYATVAKGREAVAKATLDTKAVAKATLGREAVAKGTLDTKAVAKGTLGMEAVKATLDAGAAVGPSSCTAVAIATGTVAKSGGGVRSSIPMIPAFAGCVSAPVVRANRSIFAIDLPRSLPDSVR